MVLVSMAAMGFGIGTLVIAFQVITEATMLAFVVCSSSLRPTCSHPHLRKTIKVNVKTYLYSP